jgi:hypothetical protein
VQAARGPAVLDVDLGREAAPDRGIEARDEVAPAAGDRRPAQPLGWRPVLTTATRVPSAW